MNSVQLIGRAGQDPELKTTQGGTTICNLSIATTEKWKSASGDPQERTQWHKLVAFGRTAEVMAQYVKKGHQVAVTGSIDYNEWTNKDGVKQITAQIKVDQLHLLANGRSEGRQDAAPPPGNSRMGGTPQGAQRNPVGPPPWSDEECPF